MEITLAERRSLLLLCFENGNMKRMLSFDKHSHISTIRVKFRWTKHIRQLKPKLMKETFKKSTRRRLCSVQFNVGTIESFKVQDQINTDARIIAIILKKSKTYYTTKPDMNR